MPTEQFKQEVEKELTGRMKTLKFSCSRPYDFSSSSPGKRGRHFCTT
jgi:hypothetical protein